jgi:arylsulfatase A-like enzyme
MTGEGSSHQNLLMIVVDCLRADRCPVDGDSALKLWPRLREDGAVFAQAITSASNTPVCFGSLLTGQYSFVHGIRAVTGPKLTPGIETLQGALRRHGYSTHALVTGPLLDLFGLEVDFDTYQHRGRSQHIYTEWGDQLLERFRRQEFRQPWFVLLHLFELHHPRVLREGSAPHHSAARYDLAWQQLDDRLDKLLDVLPSNTAIVLTADHGEQIGRRSDRTVLGHLIRKCRENLRLPRRRMDWRHHGFYVFEELLRIPLCICGGTKHVIVHQAVRQVDIMPTILDLLGIAGTGSTAGRSLLPLVRGEKLADVPAYVESGRDDALRHWHGLRDKRWKYVEHPRWGKSLDLEAALFDLQADPGETRNVIDQHPDVAVRMRQELDRMVYQAQAAESGKGCPMSSEEQARLYEQLRSLGYAS